MIGNSPAYSGFSVNHVRKAKQFYGEDLGLKVAESQLVMPSLNSALPFVKAGKLRALGVSSVKRAELLPEVPAIIEAGVPGYIKTAWFGLFAPAGVPDPIVDRVYQAFAKVLKDPDIVRGLRADAMVPGGEPPREFAAFVHSELAEWAKLIREMRL